MLSVLQPICIMVATTTNSTLTFHKNCQQIFLIIRNGEIS